MTKRKGLTGHQLAMFDQPKPSEVLIQNQIKNGFYSEAFNILKATGAKTSAAIFYILSRVMKTDWVKLWDEYERSGGVEFFDVTINGMRFKLTSDLADAFYLNTNHGQAQILLIDGDDRFDGVWISKIKAALLHHLDEANGAYEVWFSEHNKLPF